MSLSSENLPPALRPLDFGAASSTYSTSAAERERARAKTQGYAEGFAAGMGAVTKQGRARQQQLQEDFDARSAAQQAEQDAALAALGAAAEALSARAVPAIEAADRSLVESAMTLAEAILGHELRDGEHAASAALRRIVGAVDPSEIRAVRMHPQTAADLPAGSAERVGVTVHRDPQLAPGDAVADLPEGFIDARITAALRRCRQILAEGGDLS